MAQNPATSHPDPATAELLANLEKNRRARTTGKPATKKDISDWVFSREGGGATATEVAGPMAGALAGAKIGAGIGSLGGPVGAAAGGLLGTVVGGAAGGYYGSRGAQALRGEEYNEREARLQGALGAIPLLGRAKTVGQAVRRGIGTGAGLAGAYDVGRQTYVEGGDVSDIDLARTGRAAAAGGVVGGVIGRVVPGVRRPAPRPTPRPTPSAAPAPQPRPVRGLLPPPGSTTGHYRAPASTAPPQRLLTTGTPVPEPLPRPITVSGGQRLPASSLVPAGGQRRLPEWTGVQPTTRPPIAVSGGQRMPASSLQPPGQKLLPAPPGATPAAPAPTPRTAPVAPAAGAALKATLGGVNRQLEAQAARIRGIQAGPRRIPVTGPTERGAGIIDNTVQQAIAKTGGKTTPEALSAAQQSSGLKQQTFDRAVARMQRRGSLPSDEPQSLSSLFGPEAGKPTTRTAPKPIEAPVPTEAPILQGPKDLAKPRLVKPKKLPSPPKGQAPDIPTDPVERTARIAQLRDELQTAPSTKMAAIRKEIRRLVEEESGELRTDKLRSLWAPADRVAGLGKEKLDRIIAKQRERLADRGRPKSHLTKTQQFMRRNYDDAWTLRRRTSEAIKKGMVWTAERNPLIQLRLIRGGKVQSRIERDWTRMVDTYSGIHDQGLDDPFMEFMNLKVNERAETTVRQRLDNATKAFDAAELAYNQARAANADPKTLRPAHKAMRAAKREMNAEKRRWAQIKRGAGLQGGYEPGEATQDLQALRAKLTPEHWQAIEEAGDTFARLHDHALEEAISSGVITPELAQQYRDRGAYHAPMMRIMEQAAQIGEDRLAHFEAQRLLGARELNILKKFTGDIRTAQDPVTASMMHIAQVRRQSWENRLVTNFVDEFRRVPDYKDQVVRLDKPKQKIDTEKFASVPVWRNGQKEWWQLPRDLAEIAVSPGRLELEMMGLGPWRIAQRVKSWTTKAATTWRPSFLFGRNPPRDIGAARFNVPEVYELGNPADYAKQGVEYAKAVSQLMGDPQGLRGGLIEEFHMSGAGYSTLQRSMQPQVFIGKRQLDALRGLQTNKPHPGQAISNKVSDLASAMEMATKLVTYKRLRAIGHSEDAAAYLTRTYGGSPDFAVGGELKPLLDTMFLFFNPALRGIEQTFMAIARNRKVPAFGASRSQLNGVISEFIRRKGPSAMTRAAATFASGAMLYNMWNRAPWFRDENGEYYIERVADHIRNNNWVIFIPGLWEETESGPMPFQLNFAKPHDRVLMQSPMEKIIDRVVYGEESNYTDLGHGFADLFESASPISMQFGGESVASDIASGISSQSNPIAGLPLDIAANRRSQTGAPLIGRRESEAFPEYQYNPQFGIEAISKVVAGANVTLRDKLGWELGVSPAHVDYIIQRVVPGLHEQAVAVEDLARILNGDQTMRGMDFNDIQTWSRIAPIVGSVLKATTGPQGGEDQRLRALKDEFYQYAQRAGQRRASALLELERNGHAAGVEYYRNAPILQSEAANKAFEKLTDDLAGLHRRQGVLQMKLADLTDLGERQELIRQIQTLKQRELRGLQRWKAAKDKIEAREVSR